MAISHKGFENLSKKHHPEIPGLWTQVLDAVPWTPNSGRWTLDAGHWALDPGRWTLDSKPWMMDSGR